MTRRSADRAPVAALTAVAAVVFGWGFERGRTHPYYTAAVRSMSANWHDFVYGSFDPSGFITTDKLPGAFWVQALSVRLFGFHPWAVLLPQVLAATACVPLLFVTVRRWTGRAAGYAAALCYVLTPVTVALSRSNIPDALMVFFLVVAAHALWRWADGGRRASWWLAGSAVWLGVAFTVKMGQALLVVPVFAAGCYLLGAGGRGRRLGRAAGYGAGVAAVSLAWMVFVTLTPAADRPYIDGSVHNSVWEMVFQYNGFGRIGGQDAGSDPLSGGAVLAGAGGPAGIGRIFGVQSAGQISWLIPAAVVGLAAGLLATRRTGRRFGGAMEQRSLETVRLRTGYIFWGGWLAVYSLAFCTATGIHSYYTSTLAPPIAALAGSALVAAARGRAWQLPALVAATAGWAFLASLETPHYQPWLRWLVAVAGVLAVALLPWARLATSRALALATAVVVSTAVFAAPAVWSASVLTRHGDTMGSIMASAGPPQDMFAGRHGDRAGNAEIEHGLRDFERGPDPRLISFLKHRRGARPFAAAVDGSMAAASYLAKGVDVLPMGGFTGDAPAPTVGGLAGLVRGGELRYVVLTALHMGRTGPQATARDAWVTGHCHAVPGFDGGAKLFDCA
ncbi:MAG: phospholipid carrier-dependent glycosyltransferase [Catenulispora sp.]|nr:phospholipid carrier-dependent glycosyltransferase [Catenulispora sp.]